MSATPTARPPIDLQSYRRITEWRPNPGPQTALFQCPAEIILYGGARGGGKTTGLVMMMLRDWKVDGYRALIIRRNYTELERNIIPVVKKLLYGIGKYNEKTHRFTLRTPDGGESSLEFGYLESPSDLEAYQGSEYARIGFDESTSFTEQEIRTMYACLRSTAPGVLRQLILTCNPIGKGFAWHKKMFVDGRERFKIYEDARWPSDEKPVGASTCFIPARVWDNPALLEREPSYPDRLRSQYGPITEALLEGSWDRHLYLAFDFNESLHVVDPIEIPDSARRWMAIDWGVGTSKAATVWLAEWQGRVYAYRAFARPGQEIVSYVAEVCGMCAGEKIEYCVLSHECFAQRGHGPGNTQADLFKAVLERSNIPLIPSDRDPAGGLMLIREYLRTEPVNNAEITREYSYWLEQIRVRGAEAIRELGSLEKLARSQVLPKLKIFSGACKDLIRDLSLVVVDKERGNVLARGQETDLIDALRYGLKSHTMRGGLSAAEIYPAVLGWQQPDTGMQAEQAWEVARKISGAKETAEPFPWPTEHHNTFS